MKRVSAQLMVVVAAACLGLCLAGCQWESLVPGAGAVSAPPDKLGSVMKFRLHWGDTPIELGELEDGSDLWTPVDDQGGDVQPDR